MLNNHILSDASLFVLAVKRNVPGTPRPAAHIILIGNGCFSAGSKWQFAHRIAAQNDRMLNQVFHNQARPCPVPHIAIVKLPF
jgi:hypothetical protein